MIEIRQWSATSESPFLSPCIHIGRHEKHHFNADKRNGRSIQGIENRGKALS